MATAHRRVRLRIGWCVLSLTILTRLAHGDPAGPDSFKTQPHPDDPAPIVKPLGKITSAKPKERLTGQFPYSAPLLGPGLYDGQYVMDSLGQRRPDGSGVLLLPEGAHRRGRFDGWWNMGTPENGEYRFANGWKWYGDFSDVKFVGPLQAENSWRTGLTFGDAERQVPPPPEPVPSTVDVDVFTHPGQVTVTFTRTGHQKEQVETSDLEGNLQLALPPGSYHLTCEKPGYQSKDRDLSVGADGSRSAFCRVILEGITNAVDIREEAKHVISEEAKHVISEEAKRVVGADTFPFLLGQAYPDMFVYLVRDRARKIQSFLKSGPAVAQQPEVVQEVAEFWRRVAEAVVEGYGADCRNAKQSGRLDGNRRFLEVALGAVAANYEATKSEPARLLGDYLPFPKSDGLELADLAASPLPNTNYVWQVFPKEVREQSVAACILPRVLKMRLEEGAANPSGPKDPPPPFLLALVPDLNGSVRLAREGDGLGNGVSKDRTWRPAAPFYMAVAETSFAQMRLYAPWAERQLIRNPEQAKWFARIPATKQLVGAQNLPYMGVTLDEAFSFCNWLSFCHGREPAYTRTPDERWTQDHTKASFRLPSENEWEYAARFGFDFFAASGTRSWEDIRTQFCDKLKPVGGQPDRRLVYFSAASQTGALPRSVDDPEAWWYPLGLRDLCGNAGELCLAETPTANVLRWVVRGGQYTSNWEGAVMPWARCEFEASANKEVGFRVVLPVPMENFVSQ
jgi:Sulfatase-modifying factor enzyme 1